MPTHEQVITDLVERLNAAEAKVAALTEDRNGLVRELRAVDERFCALEAAARAATDALVGTLFECPSCQTRQRGAYRKPHAKDCPVGILAALLAGDA